MFEIAKGGRLDEELTELEKAIYSVRNCAEDSREVENLLLEISQTAKSALDCVEDELN